MLKPRNQLEESLIQVIQDSKLKTNKSSVEKIKNELRKYKVINVQSWINEPERLVPELDTRELFLLTEQVFLRTGATHILPADYFTEQEMKKSRQYVGTYELEEEIEFPYTLENILKISNKEYSGLISAELLAKLSMSRKLHYNFDIQRESVKKRVKGDIIIEPKLVMQNVLEIDEHLRNNTLKPTQITLNAAVGSAESNEPELIYDEQERRLTITRGTIIDILDGYHRTKGAELAYHKKGHLEFKFNLLLTNYSDDECRKFQGQLAKQTPLAVERAEELLGERLSDEVLKEMLPKTELQDRVSSNRHVHSIAHELVPYKLLAEYIERQFTLEKMVDVYKVSNYLSKIFNYLLGTFEEEFTSKYDEYKKTSLLNNSNMFIAYIVIARRLMESKQDPSEIINVVSGINFDKSNELWKQIGVLNDQGNLNQTQKTREAIETYFETLEISGCEKVMSNG